MKIGSKQKRHGVAIVYRPKMRQCKHNIRQINGRLLVATFNICPVKTIIVAVRAPHARRSVKDKDIFYRDIQTAVSTLPKHEISIVLEF